MHRNNRLPHSDKPNNTAGQNHKLPALTYCRHNSTSIPPNRTWGPQIPPTSVSTTLRRIRQLLTLCSQYLAIFCIRDLLRCVGTRSFRLAIICCCLLLGSAILCTLCTCLRCSYVRLRQCRLGPLFISLRTLFGSFGLQERNTCITGLNLCLSRPERCEQNTTQKAGTNRSEKPSRGLQHD